MSTEFIPFQQIPQLAKTDVAYATFNPVLKPFYKYNVDIKSFKTVIEDKSKQPINRKILVDVLGEQYSELTHYQPVINNINTLSSEKTYTIITAHQPSLLLGPLYFVYKIMSVMNLSKQLKEHYPNNHFVPTFVIGGEDHDFEEINHISLFNKNITWQNNEKGAVGMMKTDSLKSVLEELKSVLGEKSQCQRNF